MAINTQIYSPAEFKIYLQEEEVIGTANKITMKQLNVNDIVTMSQSLIQTLDIKSGSAGRILAAGDVFTRGALQPTTITVPLVYDSTTLEALHEAATAIAAVTNDITVPYNYNPEELETGGAGAGEKTYTVCLASPVAGESIYLSGCAVTRLTLTMDAGTNGGRAEGSVTFTTFFAPTEGETAPESPTAYETTFRYLCDLATKTIGGSDVVINKLEWTIENPLVAVGCDSGNPELMARAMPEMVITCNVGVKYDAITAPLWESRAAGSNISIVMTGTEIGLTAAFCKIIGDVSPAGTDAGVFIDLPLRLTAHTSGNVAVFNLD